jgi:phosphoglycerate dehydrogenase-like enzyme
MPSSSRLWAGRIEALALRFPDHRFLVGEEAAKPSIGQLEALVASRILPSLIESATSLKALFLPFTGIDQLPIEILAQRGVRVYNVHANAESVAQIALAMILAHFGRLIEYHEDLRDEKWHGFWVGGGSADEWSTIHRKRCTILGAGAIGSALARLLKAFECEVVGWRLHADAPPPPGFDRIEPTLEAALSGAEIVVTALPLTPSTRGILSRELLLSMRGVFLVNIGRGLLVDEEGLYEALRSGALAGAGIDVWYAYPKAGSKQGRPSRFPIHRLPNVVLSPHVGGTTSQAAKAAVDLTLAKLETWISTGTADGEADLTAKY